MKNKNNEFNPYASDKLSKIPLGIKVVFLKYWVAAAALFFFGIGNPIIISAGQQYTIAQYLPLYLSLSLGLGIFVDFIYKPVTNLMNSPQNPTKYYNLVNYKGMLGLLLNLLYSFIIMIPMVTILVFLAKHNINLDFINQTDSKAAIEPFTGGFVYIFLDFIVVSIKNLIVYIQKTKKYKAVNEKNELLIQKLESMSDEDLLRLDNKQRGIQNGI